MAAPQTAEQLEWWNLWGKLQAAARDLDAAVAKLQGQRAYAMSRPALAAEYQQRLTEIETARGRIVWVRDAIKSALGAVGIQLSGLAGLGLIWIPVSAAAAAVAYVAKLAADSWALAKKIDEQRRLEGQGMTAAQASAIVEKTASAGQQPGMLQQLGQVALFAGLAFGAWYLLQRRRGE